ncbi:uncharacterized protein PGTG_22534 [Puccinia graminis f. sp. tritici CRL 75-36-700-3]|uniref:Uncharacterized protein n=1 Tax=Puccinia graminis f. sp. tritici (strain CRL 75-36-700-3 / race SCCL) TaxID=418459 RepID=H6QUW3_PUCGT|nr:uncharacterized protein PGTG_22534 [Puccinia graminis f. sp. tritici CRL 75-36-700-3]EHS64871.1 hypothetical protein PGTG_22534 [Puccinia graminis f. sp. tritici CRL 75-36-700-3]
MAKVKFLLDQGKSIEKLMKESKQVLKTIHEEHGHTSEYLRNQWIRQRECQLSQMAAESPKEVEDQFEELVELEDKLREAHEEMNQLQRRGRRNHRGDWMRQDHQELPTPLALLEEEIEKIIGELGSDSIQNLTGTSNTQTKHLIKMKISKSKLYEAKVGVCEIQKKWDQRGLGTRVQARIKKIMNSKTKLLRSKWNSYDKKATDYNTKFNPENLVPTPTFDTVKAMDLTDAFWNLGSLTHPQEAWAVDSID